MIERKKEEKIKKKHPVLNGRLWE